MEVQRATPVGMASPSPVAASLPPEIVERAVAGLCWISVFTAVMSVVLVAIQHLLQPEFAVVWKHPMLRLVSFVLFFLSVGFVLVQRQGWLRKESLLDLGLVFQVFVAFAVGMFETSLISNPAGAVAGHSGIAVWMAMCGFLLPKAPLRAGIAAVLCVLMWPLALWASRQLYGYSPMPWNRMLAWLIPLTIIGVWMCILNHRIVRMYFKQQRAEDLGNYILDYQLGYGGMGEVWRAKHKMLARDAAIKLIRPEVLSAGTGREADMMKMRFEREAQATARLRSPHTVALYDFGQTKEGIFFYVMELLDGVDLQLIVDNYGPMPASRVVHIMLQVCGSLEEAHQAGMVHRDIKPKNILLCKLGLERDFSKVLDFGLVKIEAQADQSQMSIMGTATGTPAYLAPETALGNKIDGRADLYSLGCVAYYLLTGRLVFEEPTPIALAMAHVQQTPMLVSQRTELPIPAGLEEIVMKLLAKNPAERFTSAGDLASALRLLHEIKTWGPDDAARWWDINLPDVPSQTPPLSRTGEFAAVRGVTTTR